MTGNVGLELDADLELLTIVEVRLGRCVGSVEQAVGRGGRRRGDIEGLVGGKAAEVGCRYPDAVACRLCVGVPLNVRVAALKLSQAGSAEPSAAVAV